MDNKDKAKIILAGTAGTLVISSAVIFNIQEGKIEALKEELYLKQQNEQRAILKFNSNIIKLQDVIALLATQVHIVDIQVESSPIEEVIAKMYTDLNIE